MIDISRQRYAIEDELEDAKRELDEIEDQILLLDEPDEHLRHEADTLQRRIDNLTDRLRVADEKITAELRADYDTWIKEH